jgi:hypothetical protein
MKSISFKYMLICFCLVIINFGCEKTELQKPSPNDTLPIQTRTITDCGDCPDVHCCCAVEFISGTTADLLFCGVYTAMSGSLCGPFSPPSPCATVSGTSSTISLGGVNPTRVLFCLGTGGSFRLENIGDPVSIRIS